MRILYLTQYFPPEVGATQSRAFEMARGLVRAGHEVTVITEVPNHPSGVVQEEFRRRAFRRSREDGIDVIRVWVRASTSTSLVSRIALYCSFMVSATLAGVFLARGRYDIIYATSPPLFTGVASVLIRFARRTPMAFEVRDLWPESVVELGELRSGVAASVGLWLARICYRRSRKIVVVTRGIRRRLLDLGIPEDDIVLIPNGANTELYRPDESAGASIRRLLGIRDDFVLLYAGTLALAYSLETMLEAAYRLRQDPVVFLIAGSGPREASTRRLAQKLRLSNVRFLGEIPYSDLPA
jgi:glycosyltransferase involved in cell wall biosynthesis